MATAHSITYLPVVGYPGYRAGSDGSVWSCWKTSRKGAELTSVWKLLKPRTTSKGYLTVNLVSRGGRMKTTKVHRIVLEAFVGPCPEGMECRHRNNDPADNRLTNILWDTLENNRNDIRTTGKGYAAGIRNHYAKLSDDDVREVRRLRAKGYQLRALAFMYKTSVPNIHAIISRRSWKHLD